MDTTGKEWVPVCVHGFSMYPTFLPGDHVLIKPSGDIRLFDIVVCKHRGSTIIHRVVRIAFIQGKRFLSLRGDFNRSQEHVEEEQIVGKVVCYSRKNRLRFLTYEASFVYYLFVNMIAIVKDCVRRTYYMAAERMTVRSGL